MGKSKHQNFMNVLFSYKLHIMFFILQCIAELKNTINEGILGGGYLRSLENFEIYIVNP